MKISLTALSSFLGPILYARQGIGRLILSLCESAAQNEGFTSVELMATKSGEPLYLACGYKAIEHILDDRGGAPVPLIRMRKEFS